MAAPPSTVLRSGVKEGQSRYSPARPVPTTSRGHMILDRFGMTDKVAVVTGAGRGIGAATAVALAEAGRRRRHLGPDRGPAARGGRPHRGRRPRAVVVPADLNDLDAWPGWSTGAQGLRPPRHRGQQRRAGPCPAPSSTPPRGALEAGLPLQRVHRPRPAPCGRPPHARRRRRLGGQHLLGHGPPVGARAIWPTARPRGRWPTTPGWRPPTWPRGSGSTPSPSARWPPRPSTSCMQHDELRTAMETATPLGRIGDPEDIAAAIVYLCSSAGRLLRHRQGARGGRGPRPPQPRHGPPRPVSHRDADAARPVTQHDL